jgi:small subunit ribosomal protein S7
MPRKELRPRERRPLPIPDSKYNSVLVTRFINKLNYAGKKSTAESIFNDAMEIVKEKMNEDPLVVFTRCMENVRPLLEVRPRRVGGATYQVPMEVPHLRSTTIAIRWMIALARARTGKPMCERLAQEIMDASKKEGAAIKKREDTHRMAESNKAFAHYRW